MIAEYVIVFLKRYNCIVSTETQCKSIYEWLINMDTCFLFKFFLGLAGMQVHSNLVYVVVAEGGGGGRKVYVGVLAGHGRLNEDLPTLVKDTTLLGWT